MTASGGSWVGERQVAGGRAAQGGPGVAARTPCSQAAAAIRLFLHRTRYDKPVGAGTGRSGAPRVVLGGRWPCGAVR